MGASLSYAYVGSPFIPKTKTFATTWATSNDVMRKSLTTSSLQMSFESTIFETEDITLADTTETILRGGRNLFDKLPKAFEVAGADVKVSIGLREGSSSFDEARAVGFNEEDGTLGEMFDVIAKSDMVMLLISDAAQAKLYKKIFATMKKGAVLGLSH